MFRYECCLHQAVHCANHDRNTFILITIETTSRGSFDHDQTKHVKNSELCGGRRVPYAIKNRAYCEKKCLIEIWNDEEIQLQQKSAMSIKKNIEGNIAAKRTTTPA